MGIASKDNLTISEYYITQGHMPESSTQAGLNTATDQSVYLKAIEYELQADDQALIRYTLANLNKLANDSHLVFTGKGSENGVQWGCDSELTDTPSKYLPPNCRNGVG